MTKRQIDIVHDKEGNVVIKNEKGKTIVIMLDKKQLNAKDIYEVINFNKDSPIELVAKPKYSDELVSGPQNEKYRLYNYTHEFLEGLISKLSDLHMELTAEHKD